MAHSNFAFLQAEWPALYAEARRAEQAALGDPRTACFYARRTLELAVVWLYQAEGGRGGALRMPYKADLSAFLFEPSFQQLVGAGLHTKMDVIRKLGNQAAHDARPMAVRDAQAALRELFQVAFWLARHYARHAAARPAPGVQFRPEWLPQPGHEVASVRAQSQAELQKLAAEMAARDEALAAQQQKSAAYEAEIAQLRAEIAAAKAASQTEPDTHDYDEAATRDLYIDLLLREAGWPLNAARDREFAVQLAHGEAGRADYVLWGDDGKPLAVVEAKRTRRDARQGQEQARRYADALEQRFGQRPLIFYTNGYEHWLWNDGGPAPEPPRRVAGFYKKDELAWLLQRRTAARALASVPVQTRIAERAYQLRAIARVGEALEQRQRRALLVMATGAGKTRTVIALVDQLMRAGRAKRVLFLADRVALVKQAVNAFKAHLPDSAPVNLVDNKVDEGRVYVCTYPTMMGLINDMTGASGADAQRRFGVGHFDLVVVDEAHRSVYQKYRAIFDYFDALLVGLTATPKDEIDRNTYSLFQLENGVPTDAYPLEDAIAQGYLAPPRAVSVPLQFQRQGIRYADLSEAEKDQWDELEWGDDDAAPPDEVGAEAVNRWLFNTDTVDQVLRLLMQKGLQGAGGDGMGKTIIFAKNEAHARFIAERFDRAYPHLGGRAARVITYSSDNAQGLIDEFAVKDSPLRIAISVDMLDTGIDVPEVVNLVFFKMVRSHAKFWQMVGRGTRLCADLFGPGRHKTEFLIFDCCQNLEFFNQHMQGSEGAAGEPLGQRLFKARLQLLAALDERLAPDGRSVAEAPAAHSLAPTEATLRADTAHWLHAQVAGMNLANFVVRPARQHVERWRDAAAWQHPTHEQLHEVAEHLSPLPSAVRDDDVDAKRFDWLMLRTQLAHIHAEPGAARLQDEVRALASGLLELAHVPAVAEHVLLIDAVAGAPWWQDVTLPMLEQARRKLRGLIKLLEAKRREPVYTDFADRLGEVQELPLQGLAGEGFERFRLKARAFLRTHENHIALAKLRRNQPLTATDLAELERMLVESGAGSVEDVQRASDEAHGLGLFVRSLVGLDRAAAAQAFSAFVAGKALSANQLEFVDLIIESLAESGVVPVERLYESPFNDLAPEGPKALFTPVQFAELHGVLQQVEAAARAA